MEKQMVKFNRIIPLSNTTELKLIEINEARRVFFNNIKHYFVMNLSSQTITYILFELKQNLTDNSNTGINDGEQLVDYLSNKYCSFDARQMAPYDQYSMANLQSIDIIDAFYYHRIFHLTHLINQNQPIPWHFSEQTKINCQTFRFYYECDFGFQDEFPSTFLVNIKNFDKNKLTSRKTS